MKKNILLTGGAGYIGSHTCLELLLEDYNVIVVDNLSNSNSESLNRVEKLAAKKIKFYKLDILELDLFRKVFSENKIDVVIHFAGLKAVGESTEFPLKYYNNNLTGTLNLLKLMEEFKVKNIVFSSSATVYGKPKSLPINENFPVSPTNPYGNSKLFIEQILTDFYKSNRQFNIVILRYFNPVGAHKSGRIGEDPNGIPNNLMPYISQVAIGKLKEVCVFGNDYDTKDGTGVRDYIHVVDLARGHVSAIRKLSDKTGLFFYNLGTGVGYSVFDMIKAFQKITKKNIPYRIVEKRKGDIDSCFADASLANKELKWVAKYGIEDMVEDTWRWQENNPSGYAKKIK